MKLFNRVVELGGYDWVTEEKGMSQGQRRRNNVRTMEENDDSV